MGAESFGFGTGVMVALGCKYLRICHLNNCATGVATQHKILRHKHYVGTPERVVNYFKFIALETQQWLAKLGVRRLVDLIGRTDLLEVIEGVTERQKSLDLLPLVVPPEAYNLAQHCITPLNSPADEGHLAKKMHCDMLQTIQTDSGGVFHYWVNNTHRSIGAVLSGEIARNHGNKGLQKPLYLQLKGTAGQSLGVWNTPGLNIELIGDANDYVGKGMTGGTIAIYPPGDAAYTASHSTIVGNTCLYGATGGRFFAAGGAGERFAVRNSGVYAVIEGVGDHGCEYMTGGAVCVLGTTGANFGAGMTGGIAFVLDEDKNFIDRYNHELIDTHRLLPEAMKFYAHFLHQMIEDHSHATHSQQAHIILGSVY